MTRTPVLWMGIVTLLVGASFAGGAMAQQSASPAAPAVPAVPAKPAAAVDDIDPGVNTSAAAAPSAASAPPAAPAAASPGSGANRQTRPATPATAARPTGRAQDRVDLDATQITGNRELPRVLYIVPWKRSDLGDLAGKPVNSLLDEVLAPVDRDVFRRETRYFDAVSAAPAGTGMRDGSQAPESGGQ